MLPDPEDCPSCKKKGKVIDSRPMETSRSDRLQCGYRRRRHECSTCRVRWTTFEVPFPPTLLLKGIAAEDISEYLQSTVDVLPSESKTGTNHRDFYQTEEWKESRRIVMQRADWRCEHCGVDRESLRRDGSRFHIHHIVSSKYAPLRSTPSNLKLLCADCHRFVHSRANVQSLYILPQPTTP